MKRKDVLLFILFYFLGIITDVFIEILKGV